MKVSSFPIKPVLIGALTLVACEAKQRQSAVPEDEVNSVSARPEQVDRFMTTVQLPLPALLSNDALVDGKVDPELREKVLAEHKEFRERLTYISPDIEIVYEYHMILNGFSLVVPGKYADRLEEIVGGMNGASFRPQQIARPEAALEEGAVRNSWGEVDSSAFINAVAAQQKYSIDGQGISVGIIDTGIDYTHKMFGGEGTIEVYDANDPKIISEDFPTVKVAGGYDFVGAQFNFRKS